MSLRDELDRITNENEIKKSHYLNDEEAYQILLKAKYEENIANRIKEAVSKGKTTIEGEFDLQSCIVEVSPEIPLSRLSGKSSVYCVADLGEGLYGFRFRELYKFHEAGFLTKANVELTPLGVRVYNDLKNLAQKDQVILSEPFPAIYHGRGYGTAWTSGSMCVKFSYRYR